MADLGTCTTASTHHGPAVTVESVTRAIDAAIDALRRLPPPPTEIRLHPDDMRELRLRPGERVALFAETLVVTSTSLFGLPVVEDVDAPRLPRKQK